MRRLNKKARVVMLSAGLDVLARRVAEDLEIEHWFAQLAARRTRAAD